MTLRDVAETICGAAGGAGRPEGLAKDKGLSRNEIRFLLALENSTVPAPKSTRGTHVTGVSDWNATGRSGGERCSR
jgi:hypothetical protein